MLTVLWNRVLGTVLGYKRGKTKESEKNCEMISFIILTTYQIFLW